MGRTGAVEDRLAMALTCGSRWCSSPGVTLSSKQEYRRDGTRGFSWWTRREAPSVWHPWEAPEDLVEKVAGADAAAPAELEHRAGVADAMASMEATVRVALPEAADGLPLLTIPKPRPF